VARTKADRKAQATARRRLLQKLFPSDSAVSLSPAAECACPSGPEIPLPVIDFEDNLAVSSPDDPDDIIDHLFDATESIDALRTVEDDEEEDR
jgi:hypothetical protein